MIPSQGSSSAPKGSIPPIPPAAPKKGVEPEAQPAKSPEQNADVAQARQEMFAAGASSGGVAGNSHAIPPKTVKILESTYEEMEHIFYYELERPVISHPQVEMGIKLGSQNPQQLEQVQNYIASVETTRGYSPEEKALYDYATERVRNAIRSRLTNCPDPVLKNASNQAIDAAIKRVLLQRDPDPVKAICNTLSAIYTGDLKEMIEALQKGNIEKVYRIPGTRPHPLNVLLNPP